MCAVRFLHRRPQTWLRVTGPGLNERRAADRQSATDNAFSITNNKIVSKFIRILRSGNEEDANTERLGTLIPILFRLRAAVSEGGFS